MRAVMQEGERIIGGASSSASASDYPNFFLGVLA